MLLDTLIEQADAAATLTELYAIQMESRALGFMNRNLDDDKYGMFRAEDGFALRSSDVNLGGIHGLFTHDIDTWEKLRGEGSMREEDYDVLMRQYRDLLQSNFAAIRNDLNREYNKATMEPTNPLVRLFRRDLHPTRPDGDSPSPFPHLSTEENAYCNMVGVWPGPWDAPGKTYRKSALDELGDLMKKGPKASGEKTDDPVLMQGGVRQDDVIESRVFIPEMSRSEALRYARMAGLEAEVADYIDNRHLTPGCALYEWDCLPSEEELGGGASIMDKAFSPFERKEILSKEFAKNYTAMLTSGGMRSMAAPQSWEGVTYRGSNAAYLLACMQSRPDGQPLFLSRDDMARLGVTPYRGSEPVSILIREAGDGVIRDVVWNIADTNYPEKNPGEYEALCKAMAQPLKANFNAETAEAAARNFRQHPEKYEPEVMAVHNPRLSESEDMLSRVLVESVFKTACGDCGTISGTDLPFPEAVALSKDGGRLPAYEIYRHSGRLVDVVANTWHDAYPRKGVDCESLVAEYGAYKVAENLRNAQGQKPSTPKLK